MFCCSYCVKCVDCLINKEKAYFSTVYIPFRLLLTGVNNHDIMLWMGYLEYEQSDRTVNSLKNFKLHEKTSYKRNITMLGVVSAVETCLVAAPLHQL